MRVLYWTELFWPHIGGRELMSQMLIRAQKQRGMEFIVVASHSGLNLPDETDYEGTCVYRFPFQKALAERDLHSIEQIVRRVTVLKQAYAPDLIHLNSIEPGIFFQQLTASASAAPVLFTLHGMPFRASAHETLAARLLRSSAWVTSCSRAALDAACHQVPEIVSHSSVIPYGLDLPNLDPAPLPFQPPRLLCLGRVVAQKGFDLVLEALPGILDGCPETRVVIAGDGPARADLERRAGELHVSHAVEFVGWVDPDGVPALINSCTVVVIPSREHEGLPLVALQAAQMARPVVATAVGGVSELVVDRLTGALVPEQNVNALGEAVVSLLRHPDRAERMGMAARRRAQTDHSFERYSDEYACLYRRLGAQASIPAPQ